MSRQRYFIILGLAAFVVTSQAPPASASIFGDALRVVKKTTKKAVGVVRDVTGISALEQRRRVARENAKNRAQAAADVQLEKLKSAVDAEKKRRKQQIEEANIRR